MKIIEFESVDDIRMLGTGEYVLSSFYDPYDFRLQNVSYTYTEGEFSRFGAFVYDENDLPDFLKLKEPKVDIVDCKDVITISDMCMRRNTVIFKLFVADPTSKVVNILNSNGYVLYPRILVYGNEKVVCFVVEDKVKTRGKKIIKLLKNIRRNDI